MLPEDISKSNPCRLIGKASLKTILVIGLLLESNMNKLASECNAIPCSLSGLASGNLYSCFCVYSEDCLWLSGNPTPINQSYNS